MVFRNRGIYFGFLCFSSFYLKMCAMIELVCLHLQFRENVAAWVCFYDRKDAFKGFLGRVLRLKSVCARSLCFNISCANEIFLCQGF